MCVRLRRLLRPVGQRGQKVCGVWYTRARVGRRGHLRHAQGHWAELNFDRVPALAAELVELKVDVIAALATRASVAAKQATSTIPVVMTLSLHAVESGLVQSLAHPGGNVTGMTGMSDQTIAKRLELLKEALPRLSRIAVL
jgi:putative tryptophan/tyrosine transport system substrate-binding protein